ncbi:MAG: DUF3820 family protein [Bacteriovoracaceae bacterium]|jgi:uncharacterized protein|nr:DUF3820 family protein [Bacteriovoracaceae bacterium]
MSNYNPESLKKIISMEMPYGKYRGVKLIDLPETYVVWYYENELPKGELGRLLAELYEIKVNGLESLVKSIQF